MAAKNVPQKKEDYITNKVLAVFSICLAGVLVLMGLRKLIDFGTTYLLGMTVLRVLMGVAAAGVVLSIVLMAHQKKKGADLTYRILTGRNLLIVFAVALVILALVHHYGIPIFKVFYGLLPALAVYYLIYHSYQPEFCVISVDCGAAVALLLIVRRAQISANVKYLAWVALAVYVALAVVQLTMTAQVKNAKGKLKLGGRTLSFQFSKNAYTMLTVTPIVMAILVALGAAMGTGIALYAIFAAAGYLFVTAVYYTVKLM